MLHAGLLFSMKTFLWISYPYQLSWKLHTYPIQTENLVVPKIILCACQTHFQSEWGKMSRHRLENEKHVLLIHVLWSFSYENNVEGLQKRYISSVAPQHHYHTYRLDSLTESSFCSYQYFLLFLLVFFSFLYLF